jgi:L-iditol 2-dehydrogenase
MKALVLPEPGKMEIRDVPTPVPGPQEVLCRVRAVAICGSDPEIIRGGLPGLPSILSFPATNGRVRSSR